MTWRPLARDRDPQRLRVGLERTMRHLRAPAVEVTRALFEHWPELVGHELAEHAVPVAIDDGELVLVTTDPAWASQLRWLGDQLIDRVNEGLGSQIVTSVTVRLRPR